MEEEGLECVFHVAGAGRGCDKGVGRVSGLEGAGEELGGEEGEVVVDGKGCGFCVKVLNGRHLHTSGSDAEGVILEGLELGDVGCGGVGEPDGGSIEEEGTDNGFVCEGDGFDLLAPGGASESLKDIEAGGGAGDEIGDVGAKGEMGV